MFGFCCHVGLMVSGIGLWMQLGEGCAMWTNYSATEGREHPARGEMRYPHTISYFNFVEMTWALHLVVICKICISGDSVCVVASPRSASLYAKFYTGSECNDFPVINSIVNSISLDKFYWLHHFVTNSERQNTIQKWFKWSEMPCVAPLLRLLLSLIS